MAASSDETLGAVVDPNIDGLLGNFEKYKSQGTPAGRWQSHARRISSEYENQGIVDSNSEIYRDLLDRDKEMLARVVEDSEYLETIAEEKDQEVYRNLRELFGDEVALEYAIELNELKLGDEE
ncbi:hypothetical protein GLU60_02605 [Nanohaloarchaea archaeon H01]|nr:hypothetical protein [Nanohaloarchaea archaeon H01]